MSKQTTFDTIAASTSVPWIDPGTTAKTFTTHDMVTERVTVQAPKNKRGDTQVYAGELYTFTGSRWVLTK